jgi:hypothetical protein
MPRFFFEQDTLDHWYIVPAELREKWQQFYAQSTSTQDFETAFEQYRVEGSPSQYTFENPQEDTTL